MFVKTLKNVSSPILENGVVALKTDHQPRLDAWDKCSGLVHWEDPEESGGEGGGRRDQDGEHM